MVRPRIILDRIIFGTDGVYGDVTVSGNSWSINQDIDKDWTGSHSFLDNKFSILDNLDNTKELQFQLSGLTASTTRTLTIPDASGTIALQSYVDQAESDAVSTANAYADSIVIGLWDDRGNFDASVNAYPSSGGSGSAGAILKGDVWTVSVGGTLPTAQVVEVGDIVRALVDTPGNTQANWAIQQNNIGYIAENSVNKTDIMAGNEADSTKYLSAKGVYDWVTSLGGGITNGAAANELMKSDGTNAVASGLESTSAGNLNLGLSGTSGTTRALAAAGSASDIDLTLSAKGTGVINIGAIKVTSDGRLYGTALHNNAGAVTGTTNQYVASGTYTPTATAILNLDSNPTMTQCQWIRVGNVVTVSGAAVVDATAAAGTFTSFRFTLPIASTFTQTYHLSGAIGSINAANEVGTMLADAGTGQAYIGYYAQTTVGSSYIQFHFTYLIL